MFSITTAPAKQKTSETISTLSARLNSATLLEDRRAAILGLRSFAKDYPASVASGGLRGLIVSLIKDAEDADTVKYTLETLLSLFDPNEESPEASEEIKLWLADEFTQRQENVSLLLDFADSSDFYSKLYSLRLLAAILTARTDRMEDCILKAPLGISRLVSILEDRQAILRNEALNLLISLTESSTEIQKLVAFDNAFERLFFIIDAEGSFQDGDQTVENCLILLANLLRWNLPNQTIFRESGCVVRLAALLKLASTSQVQGGEAAGWVREQATRNMYALLAVIRLFMTPGAIGTPQNQSAFRHHGLLSGALNLAFNHEAEVMIRSEALLTCADMIRDNPQLQEHFAQLQVPALLPPCAGNDEDASPIPKLGVVFVIDGLLDLVLNHASSQSFDLRRAAYECLMAYLGNHSQIRLHFLTRAIDGHNAGAEESANVLTVVLRTSSDVSDPYRVWFAAMIMFQLLFNDSAAKTLALAVTEGDASTGEEVVTSVQKIAANLVRGIKRDEDPRILVGNLVLLIGWLFEDQDAVNALLSEAGLIQDLSQPSSSNEVVQGLCVLLLGVAYEFSTKDSPIPRPALQAILASRLGRDRYLNRLRQLRSDPMIRDFEVLPRKFGPSASTLPLVLFEQTFVDFFKDNYSRFVRIIDQDPGLEMPVTTNGVQKGISRELVDSLRSQVEERDKLIWEAREELAILRQRLEEERLEFQRVKAADARDIAQVRDLAEADHKHYQVELKELQDQLAKNSEVYRMRLDRAQHELENTIKQLQKDHVQKEEDWNSQAAQIRSRAASDLEKIQRRHEAEIADLKATISRLEVASMKANKTRGQEMQSIRDQYNAKLAEHIKMVDEAHDQVTVFEAKVADLEVQAEQSRTAAQRAEKERIATQAELDDLLIVFGDLEERLAKYQTRLRALGEHVSDGEED